MDITKHAKKHVESLKTKNRWGHFSVHTETPLSFFTSKKIIGPYVSLLNPIHVDLNGPVLHNSEECYVLSLSRYPFISGSIGASTLLKDTIRGPRRGSNS